MKRLLSLAVLMVLIGPAHASGDGCPPQSCGFESVAVPGSPVVAMRLGGGYDAYDVATGRQRFSLPYGLETADGRSFFTATNRAGATDIRGVDARTARHERDWTLGPRLSLTAVATDGSYVALQRPARVGRSAFVVLDTGTGKTQGVSLQGMFSAEAVTRDGRRLFLIQYVDSGYRVRVYDLARRALRPGELKARNETEPMRGYPAYAIGARDGRWLLTLYVKPRQHEAFVHALDLRRAVAYCLDLPGHGTSAEVGVWSLTLGLDGKTLYAANRALGLATRSTSGRSSRRSRCVSPRRSAPISTSTVRFRRAATLSTSAACTGSGRTTCARTASAARTGRSHRRFRVHGRTDGGSRCPPGGRPLWLDAATGRRL